MYVSYVYINGALYLLQNDATYQRRACRGVFAQILLDFRLIQYALFRYKFDLKVKFTSFSVQKFIVTTAKNAKAIRKYISLGVYESYFAFCLCYTLRNRPIPFADEF